MKNVYSFRIDEKIINKLRKLGVDVSRMVNDTLEKVAKEEKCPTCGQIKRRKKSSE